MYSVDLAADAFFRELGVDFDFFQFAAGTRSTYGRMRPIDYRSPNQLTDYQKVFLWGDFTSLPNYGRNDFTVQVSRAEYGSIGHFLTRRGLINKDHKTRAYARWVQLFVDGPAQAKASYSIGQNFQRLVPPPAGDPAEFAEAEGMLSHFTGICVRDSVSYSNVAAMTFPDPDAPRLKSGMDVAFLVPTDPAARTLRAGGNRPTIGLFFKRSRLQHVDRLARALEGAGFRVVFIDNWLRSRGDISRNFRDALTAIRACDVTLSDTYHFLINSHREGCAIVGVGRPSTRQLSTVGDYKKKVLFSDLGMADAYFEIEDGIIDERVSRTLTDAVAKAVAERFQSVDRTHTKIDEFRRQLKDFIN